MIEYSDYRHSLKGFLSDHSGNIHEALTNLMGCCMHSTDPDVRGAYERWKALNDLKTFLEAPRAERV